VPERITLEKSFKPHWVWAIAFGSAIGWGSFVLPVEWMETAGPMGVIIGLWIGALLLSFVGLSAGYLVKAYPVTGGAFTYAYLAFGRKHAFLCGWFLILGYAAIVALNASAFALMIKFLLPDAVKLGFLYSVAGWDVYLMEVLTASAVLIIFAGLNIRGADSTAQTQFYFCILLIAAATGVTVAMCAAPETSIQNMLPAFKPGIPSWSAIAAIVAISPWAYVGFDTVPQAAEEFNFSPGKATFLILAALVVAASHYSIMILATGVAMPWMQLVDQHFYRPYRFLHVLQPPDVRNEPRKGIASRFLSPAREALHALCEHYLYLRHLPARAMVRALGSSVDRGHVCRRHLCGVHLLLRSCLLPVPLVSQPATHRFPQ
jgi:amino acid transporter